jgi:isopentenyl-diphosphate delta-isomerase type 1
MEETLCVVDENDRFLRGEKRKIVHGSELWHRGVHIFLFNKDGAMLVQKRAPQQDKFPNRIEESVSEHVKVGESYEEAAERGLFEELVVKASFKDMVYFRCNYGQNDNMICKLFECHYDDEIIPNDEIAETKYMTEGELRETLKQDPDRFTPWFQEHLKWLFGLEHNLYIFEE